jgi:hypothetical protein
MLRSASRLWGSGRSTLTFVAIYMFALYSPNTVPSARGQLPQPSARLTASRMSNYFQTVRESLHARNTNVNHVRLWTFLQKWKTPIGKQCKRGIFSNFRGASRMSETWILRALFSD